MRQTCKIVKVLLVVLFLICCVSCQKKKNGSPLVEFKNPAFKKAVEKAEFSERGKLRSYPFGIPTEEQILQITSLNLNFNGETDYSLEDINKFPNLKGLYIAGPTNKAILEIKEMKQLKSLHIQCDDPFINLEPIGDMDNIKALGITSNKNRDWSFVGRMNQLDTLYLCSLTADNLNFLSPLGQLPRLVIRDSDISGISGLQGLTGTKIIRINQWSNDINVDFSDGLKNLKNIELLDIDGSPLKNLDFLKEMNQLKWLALDEVGDVKFPEWFKIENYPNLKKLTLDENIKQNNADFFKDFMLVIEQRAKEGDIKNIFWDERLAFPNSLEIMNDLDHNDKRWDQ